MEQSEAFRAEQAQAIHWHKPPPKILGYTNPPLRRWFAGGETHPRYDAVDRHLAERGDQAAVIPIPAETNVICASASARKGVSNRNGAVHARKD
ncbi:MAG: acetyl-coenzyme A synthetase N-terminal domain-containing protein [Rudaea sp.]